MITAFLIVASAAVILLLISIRSILNGAYFLLRDLAVHQKFQMTVAERRLIYVGACLDDLEELVVEHLYPKGRGDDGVALKAQLAMFDRRNKRRFPSLSESAPGEGGA